MARDPVEALEAQLDLLLLKRLEAKEEVARLVKEREKCDEQLRGLIGEAKVDVAEANARVKEYRAALRKLRGGK